MTQFKVGDKVRYTGDSFDFPTDVFTIENVNPDDDVYMCRNTIRAYEGLWAFVSENMALVEQQPDVVSHPSHYSAGMPDGVEVIDIIRAQGWEDNYLLGNACKYLLRCEHKGTKKQDLEKLMVYVQWEIDRLESD